MSKIGYMFIFKYDKKILMENNFLIIYYVISKTSICWNYSKVSIRLIISSFTFEIKHNKLEATLKYLRAWFILMEPLFFWKKEFDPL